MRGGRDGDLAVPTTGSGWLRRASVVTAAAGASLALLTNSTLIQASQAASARPAAAAASIRQGPTRIPTSVRPSSTTTTAGVSLALRRPAPTTTTTNAPTTTTTTADRGSAPNTCGGQPTLVAEGMTWHCTFDSEFTGTSIDRSQWTAVTTAESGFTNGETACYVDSPNNYYVANGYLTITARKEAAPFLCSWFYTQYTSATLATYGLFSQAYGRFEIDAKVPSTSIPGLQSSFWLYPQNETMYGPWPASGEIDVAETYSEYPGIAIPYIHYLYTFSDAASNTNVVTAYDCSINPDQFNDYVVDWTPTSITTIYNGKVCMVDHWVPTAPETAPEPFNQPFFINLTQALGVGTNSFNANTTPLPASTEVKFVRVWQSGS